MKQIFAADIGLQNAPSRVRAKLAGSERSIQSTITFFKTLMDEVFILSASDRFIVYGYGNSIDPLTDYYLSDPELAHLVHFCRSTEASVNHLFATASGLCSEVTGERRILDQLKRAHRLALKCGSIGLVLDNLLRNAVRVGKKVRAETHIAAGCASIVNAGLNLLRAKFGSLKEKTFLLLGTDKVVSMVLHTLRNEGVHGMFIAGVDGDAAGRLSIQYQTGVVSLKELNSMLPFIDVIISSSHLPLPFLSEDIERACDVCAGDRLPGRRILLDFGMPKNFPDRIRRHPLIDLYNLNDLTQQHHASYDILRGLDEAWQMIGRESKIFMAILREMDEPPVLAAYWERLLKLKEEQLSRLLPKLDSALEKDRELIRRYTHKLIRSIAREPSRNLRAHSGDTLIPANLKLVRNIHDFKQIKITFSNN